MAISEFAKQYYEKMFPDCTSEFLETDSEFMERFENFAFDEVINQDNLDDKTRFMAILAALLGCRQRYVSGDASCGIAFWCDSGGG